MIADSTDIDTRSGVVTFTDMPNAVYHANRSHVSRSTAHRYRGLYGGRAQRYSQVEGKSLFAGNKSTDFGTLVDGAFEAECRGVDWRSRCAVAPPSVLTSNGQRRGRAFEEWRAALPIDAVECSEADFSKVADIIAAIREHKGACELIDATTSNQFSVFRTDENGHNVKARADGVTPSLWYDLKTTSSDWDDIQYSFRRFGYDWQAAWYTDAAIAAGWEPFDFQFIVVQAFPPFDVTVYRLPEWVIDRARQEIKESLAAMRRRMETGVWVDATYHVTVEMQFRG
jgi:hypothetical protein